MADSRRQLVGPLTTIFTPPSSCLQTITSGQGTNWAKSSSLFIGNFGGNYRSAASSCYPDATTSITFGSLYYWSPAYSEYCPSGYRTACQYVEGYFVGSTASICCPTGYSCGGANHLCSSTASDTTISVFVATDQTGAPTALSTITLEGLHYIWNDGIPIVWNMDSDASIISSLSSVHAHAGSTATSSQPSNTGESSTALSPRSSSGGSSTATDFARSGSDLSTGAKAGIGVGVSLGFLLSLGALFLFLRSRRRRNTVPSNNLATAQASPYDSKLYPQDGRALQNLEYGTEYLASPHGLSEMRDRSTVPGVELPTW